MKPLDDIFEKDAIAPILGAALGAGATSVATGRGGVGTGVLSALAGPAVGGAVGSQLGDTTSPASEDSLREETIGELFDPEHESELTRIRTQAMLSEFLSVDPVISTYDPDEVTDAYNQIVQLAPRAGQQPAVMRGMLRKMLQQQDSLEPFEADQIVKIETGMKNLAAPAERLMTPPGA